MKLGFGDTETTGLPKSWKEPVENVENWPRVIEFGGIFLKGEASAYEEFTLECLIKPIGFEIPPEATAIHGITTEKAMEEGIDPADAFKGIHAGLEMADFVCGHNISFDMKVLNAEFIRLGLPKIQKPQICTMMKGRGYAGGKWPKLGELYMALFGRQFEEAHRAGADIRATVECFHEMVVRGDIVIAPPNEPNFPLQLNGEAG